MKDGDIKQGPPGPSQAAVSRGRQPRQEEGGEAGFGGAAPAELVWSPRWNDHAAAQGVPPRGPFRVRLAFKVRCTALLPASGCSSTCCWRAVSEPPLMAVVEVKVRGLRTFPVKVPMTPSVGFEA